MDGIRSGSYEWIAGIIDNEGMPDALEFISSGEIEDEYLGNLWEQAMHIYNELYEYIKKIEKYVEGKIEEGE